MPINARLRYDRHREAMFAGIVLIALGVLFRTIDFAMGLRDDPGVDMCYYAVIGGLLILYVRKRWESEEWRRMAESDLALGVAKALAEANGDLLRIDRKKPSEELSSAIKDLVE